MISSRALSEELRDGRGRDDEIVEGAVEHRGHPEEVMTRVFCGPPKAMAVEREPIDERSWCATQLRRSFPLNGRSSQRR